MGRTNARRFIFSTLCAMLVALVWTNVSQALSITYLGSSGSLNASALFNLTGSTLTVTLTNTSGVDVLKPADVLTGVFFNTTHTLTPVSASLNGSDVFYGSISNAGDGWGYGSGLKIKHGNDYEKNSAISATGAVKDLGQSNFSAANNNLDGLDYGILSAGDVYDPNTDNGGIQNGGPLIKHSVLFTLTADKDFILDELGTDVVFQYGTDLSETYYLGSPCTDCPTPPSQETPEPSTWIMLVTGTLCLLGYGWSRRRAQQDAEPSI